MLAMLVQSYTRRYGLNPLIRVISDEQEILPNFAKVTTIVA